MLQKPATKQLLTAVPSYSRLFRRGATYYFRVSVPKDLRKDIGKTEIIRSLRTTDFAKAKRLVAFESANADALLDSAREKLKHVAKSRRDLASLSDAEIHRLVMQWFRDLEKESEDRFAMEDSSLDPEELAEVRDNLRVDEVVFSGGSVHYRPENGSVDLERFLAERGIDATSGSPPYEKARELFRRARLENTRRTLDRFAGQTFQRIDPLLQHVSAYSALPESSPAAIKLGEFLARFLKFIENNRSETTFTTYQTPVRVMEELLGSEKPLDSINREDIERLAQTLKQMPRNAHQRYPNLAVEAAIAEASKRGDTQKLGAKTLENYFRNISAVFNFAVEEKYITQSPAKYRSLREQFRSKQRAKKATFTCEQLHSIFRAPLFTGCMDDEAGFSRRGSNKPRRGRFWVPLLALFQGLRCNEACQLYIEDVKESDDIPYLAVRTELDEDDSTDKRLKNASSSRKVPIHPTLISLGFLEFVTARRNARGSNRLFAELKAGKTGRYSNPFSKWFGRFLSATFDVKPKGTFHSFRHHFRDALRAARIGDEIVEALGGWAGEGKQQREYGQGPSLRMLLEDLAKVEYPGLELSHLYAQEGPSISLDTR